MFDSISLPWLAVLSGGLLYTLWFAFRQFDLRGKISDIPGPPPESWWMGNLGQLENSKAWSFHEDIVKKYGKAIKIHGMWGDEQLYLSDPRGLHHVIIKDQYVYEESSNTISFNLMSFGQGLLSSLGSVHKKQRKMLNPVFSIKHMRGLIEVFYPIAHQLCDGIADEVRSGVPEINIMSWFSRAALEYIGQGGMGYSFDALDTTKKNVYGDAVKMFIPAVSKLRRTLRFLPYLTKMGPAWFRRQVVDIFPSESVQRLKSIIDTMERTSVEIVEKKRAAFQEGEEAVVKQLGMGKDIMSILLRANMAADEKDRLSEEELIGQMTIFIFAGHDTTTSALTRILWILSRNPEAQERLRNEVTQARAVHGDLDYDILMNLPYLDAVCREMMRLYPPVPILDRVARKDMVLPLSYAVPGADGKPVLELQIKKNTRILISILAANKSKEIWGDDAEEWKPERWLGRNDQSEKDGDLFSSHAKNAAKEQLPGVYSGIMTFLGGGRACIGFKFSEMEMKLVLSIVLERFKFEPGAEVQWNMIGITTPSVVGRDASGPQLPLRISLVK